MQSERTISGPSAFGSLLRSYRQAAGLSQEALAERARISVQGVGALERGDRRTPQRETLELLATALGLDAEQRVAFETAAARPSGPRAARASVTEMPLQGTPRAPLPYALTSFVGREREVAELCALVREQRLVTVVGPGGMGKTRIALEVARKFDESDAGVRVVELAPISLPSQVAAAIAATLGLQEVPNHPILDTLTTYLQREQLLIVLDNCEQVIEEAAGVVDRLLRACPSLRILATSREPLRVAGERVFRLPALPAPSIEEARALDAAGAARFAAAELFVQRAVAADRAFALTAENARSVGAICARLDGMPLAIELAAARVASLSPASIAAGLEESFALLSRGARTAPVRHQTMAAAIEWSYAMLSPAERLLFDRLAIFAGGCTLEAATAVCSGDGVPARDLVDLIASLVEKSLVLADTASEPARYRMLESFRDFAREKLAAEAGASERLAARHARVYVDLAEQWNVWYDSATDAAIHRLILRESENVRAALNWTLESGRDVELGQWLVLHVYPIWNTERPVEARRWLELATAKFSDAMPERLRITLRYSDAMELAREFTRDSESADAALVSARRMDELGDRRNAASVRFRVARAFAILGRPEDAEPLLEHVIAESRANGWRRVTSSSLLLLARLAANAGNLERTRALAQEAVRLSEELDSPRGSAYFFELLAEICVRRGDPAGALPYHLQSLAAGHTDDHLQQACCLTNVAAAYVALDRFDEAQAYALEAVDVCRFAQLSVPMSLAIQHLAAVAALSPGNVLTESAARRIAAVLGYVDVVLRDAAEARDYSDEPEYRRILAALATVLPQAEIEAALARGASFDDREALAALESA